MPSDNDFICDTGYGKYLGLIKQYVSGLVTRDSICYCTARYAIARPTVRLSHGWISRKRLNLGSLG